MTRLAAGDRHAREPLFALLYPCLRSFVGRQLPPSDADDAAQEALLKVFSRATRFDPHEGDALSWAFGIAAYEVRTMRTRQARRREEPSLEPLAGLAAVSASPEQSVLDRDLEQAALDVLGTLRPSDVETLRAVASGARPEVPAATFRKRVERALHRFRMSWRARHGTD